MKIMVDSEYLDKLQKSLGVDGEGNAVVGKNLEVDGSADFLGKEIRILEAWDNNTDNIGCFIGYVDEANYLAFGIIIGYLTGLNYSVVNADYDVFDDKSEPPYIQFAFSKEDCEGSGIITQASLDNTLKHGLKTLFGNQSIAGEGNIDLYRHKLTLNGSTAGTTLNIEILSSSNLKCDSVQDLRTLLKVGSDGFLFLYGNLYQSPYTQCQLAVSADICQFTPGDGSPINVTTVSDTVTTI